MQVFLEAIKFNHDHAPASVDALNIRRNESEPAPFPEWQRGISFTAEDSMAAYAIEPKGKSISVHAKFKTSIAGLSKIKVRAIDASSPFSTPNILGSTVETDVTFAANGESDFVAFKLKDVRLEETGVGISRNVWRWQFLDTQPDRWSDFAKTTHKIYSVLDVPQEPWSQVDDINNTQLPWTEVLDVACEWARGAKGIEEAAALITQNVYDLGLGLVGYQGSPAIYALTNFNCTEFLKLLRGTRGMGECLNCSDCATLVSTLANLLGSQTYQVHLPGFLTNPIILISRSRPHVEGFDAHEVAWTGETVEEGLVLDGCLQVDGDPDPANSVKGFEALLPTNLRFGLPDERNYRFRVASANKIEPALLQRHRRPIGVRIKSSFVQLDPERLKALETTYDFKSWKDSRSKIFFERAVASIDSILSQNWKRINEQPQQLVDSTSLAQFLWKPISSDSESAVLLLEDIFECVDVQAARALLLRLLGEYRSVTVKRVEVPVFGDVDFLADDGASMLFAASNYVVLIRSAGKDQISLEEAGLQLGNLLNSLDKSKTKNNQLRSNLMPHEMKSTFTSLTFNQITTKRYEPDFLGDFDLTNISDDGNLDRCTRKGLSTKPITGQVTNAQGLPFAYDVIIDQVDPITVHYRGVALRNDAGEITRIVGSRRIVFAENQEAIVQALVGLQQDETTWVVTKP